VEALLARRFDDLKLLVIYIDGLVFGDYTMIGAVGVDSEGNKHVLGIREGATENSTVITELLEDIVSRGVDPKRKMLFVIDGSKALRAAINAVFGSHQPVQRCRATSCAMCSTTCPRTSGRRSRACCARPGNWDPRRAWRRSKSWPRGWITATPRRGQPAGRPGGMLYHQPAGSSALSASLLGDNQHHREPARRCTHPDPPRYPLAERQNGSALDGLGVYPNREAVQQNHGPPRFMGPGSYPQPLCDRQPKGGVVTST